MKPSSELREAHSLLMNGLSKAVVQQHPRSTPYDPQQRCFRNPHPRPSGKTPAGAPPEAPSRPYLCWLFRNSIHTRDLSRQTWLFSQACPRFIPQCAKQVAAKRPYSNILAALPGVSLLSRHSYYHNAPNASHCKAPNTYYCKAPNGVLAHFGHTDLVR